MNKTIKTRNHREDKMLKMSVQQKYITAINKRIGIGAVKRVKLFCNCIWLTFICVKAHVHVRIYYTDLMTFVNDNLTLHHSQPTEVMLNMQ